MAIKIVLFTITLCVFINISEQRKYNSDISLRNSYGGYPQYDRIHTRPKRAKYFPSPFRYRRPLRPDFPKGIFSYTPPPNYLMNDDEQYANVIAPGKPFYNKKPSNNLDDEDINNLFKNLSKPDLDKILEFANEKDKEWSLLNKYKEAYKQPEINATPTEKAYNIEWYNADVATDNADEQYNNAVSTVQQNQNQGNVNGPFASQINEGINDLMPDKRSAPPVLFTDSKNMREEILPKPVNLRDEPTIDYQISDTKNVPSYAKAASLDSYKAENFGELPLSDYSSKLSSVSSYNVPHYTVTSNTPSNPAPRKSSVPSIEPAPSATSSAAYAESDAHLKAIKIWTHKSKGMAYTLHNDGTLSIERPLSSRPKHLYQ